MASSMLGLALLVTSVTTAGAMKAARRYGANSSSAEGSIQPASEGKSPYPSRYVIDHKRCASGFYHVTCALDTQDQKYWYHDVVAKHEREKMTPKVCYDFCKNVTGTQYMGLKRGDQCYCTPFFHNTDKGGLGACDVQCEGDPTQRCGGKDLVDVYQLHDCSNMPALACKRPPGPIEHAKLFESNYYKKTLVPCSNAVAAGLTTVDRSQCQVECDLGFTLVENSLTCDESGDRVSFPFAQITGSALCVPTTCGFPAEMPHQTYPRSEVLFPDSAAYACDIGYSLDGLPDGPKEQNAVCQPSGKLTEVKPCKPVLCADDCPSGDGFMFTENRNPGKKVYGDKCIYECVEGYTLDGQADGKSSFSTGCLSTGAFAPPMQCKPVVAGPLPLAPFAAVQAGLHIMVSELNEHFVAYYPQKFNFWCDAGYSLNGVFGGPVQFELKTKPDGSFTAAPTCRPVTCGVPPVVDKAIYVETAVVYPETVSYTCQDGYTLTGTAGDVATKVIGCRADGKYDQAPVCLPVECGPVPAVEKAGQDDVSVKTANFASQPVKYISQPGYSTAPEDNPWERLASNLTLRCLASGSYSDAPAVLNINNCAWNNCGEFGACRDLPDPTGVVLNDYTCDCFSGYEITLASSTVQKGEQRKVCTNIFDCPTPLESACGGVNDDGLARGQCLDLINGYDCVCGGGYKIGTVEGLEHNKTCLPVECGTAAAVEFASGDLGGKPVNYDTPDWSYTCNAGHSIDGTAAGVKTFTAQCTSSGEIHGMETCQPVSCGKPKRVKNSDVTPKLEKVVYGQSLAYTCDLGYTTDGKAAGVKTFDVPCNTGGLLEYPDYEPPTASKPTDPNGLPLPEKPPAVYCKPVECGKLAVQQHADFDAETAFVYPETTTVTCQKGHSIDATTNKDAKTYLMSCNADGSMPAPYTCAKISCGLPPTYAHASRADGELFYGDEITYALEAGFEMTGVAPGGTCSCTCQDDGKLDGNCLLDSLDIEPRDCGTAPAVAHATVDGSTIYGQKLVATAKVGFTVDGSAKGVTSCEFRCQSDGTFTEPCSFQPVKCGLCPNYDHVDDTKLQQGSASFLIELGKGSLSGPGKAKGTTALGLRSKRAVRGRTSVGANDACAPVYSDRVVYSCSKGYYVSASTPENAAGTALQQVLPSLPTSLTVECIDTGLFVEVLDAPAKAFCMPVTCDVAAAADGELDIPLLPRWSPLSLRLRYTDVQDFTCADGYSLDGTPAGVTRFQETCQEDGQLTNGNDCKDIDWCLISKCGENGACNDGLLAYSCTCNPGYQVSYIAGTFQTCTQIDECETQRGNDACKPGGGLCVDELLKYSCQCVEGYEHTTTPLGYDACVAKSCGVLPMKANAVSARQGEKIVFPNRAAFSCSAGHTLDGTAAGSTAFELTCKSDAQFGGLEAECQPVKCGAVPTIARAVLAGDTTEFVFPGSATYTCNEGHTTTGVAGGITEFSITCQASGNYTDPAACKPVSCGEPPRAANAVLARSMLREASPKWFSDTRAPYALVAKSSANQGSTTIEVPLSAIKDVLGPLEGKRFYLQSALEDRDSDALKVGNPFASVISQNHDFSQWAEVSCSSDCTCGVARNGRLGNHGGNSIEGAGAGCAGRWRVTTGWNTGGSYILTFYASTEDTVACKFTVDNKIFKVVYDGQDLTSSVSPQNKLDDWVPAKYLSFISSPSAYLVIYGQDSEQGRCSTSGLGLKCRRGGHFGNNVAANWEALGSSSPIPEGDQRLVGSGSGWAKPCVSTSGFNLQGESDYVRIWASAEMNYALFRWQPDAPKAVFGDLRSYSCNVGYSLDAVPKGPTSAEVRCQADGSFSAPPVCQSINCGFPTKPTYGVVPVREFRYNEEHRTTCNAGYSTSAESTGETSYVSRCTSDGSFQPSKVPAQVVHCSFAVDDVVKSVAYNGVDIKVNGDLGLWNAQRSFEFALVPGAYLVITAMDVQAGNSCNSGGFAIYCNSMIDGTSQWEAVGSNREFSKGDPRLVGGGTGWGGTCKSQTGFNFPDSSPLRSAKSVQLWAASGEQNAIFRLKTEKDCELNPDDSARTYSSIWGPNDVWHKRSSLNSPQAWSANANQPGEWMQMDLGSVQSITGVVTQARASDCCGNQRVTKFAVQTSTDGSSFTPVGGTFERATTDNNQRVRSFFSEAVRARYVRVIVQAWENHISMRAGVLTCKKPEPETTPAAAGPGELRPGMIVSLTGGRSDRFCADESSRIICDRTAVGQWERYEVVNTADGRLALRGGKDRWFCADEGYRVTCNRAAIGPWESFTMQKGSDNKVSLKGGKDGLFCADDVGGVICNRGAVGPWEEYSVQCLENCLVPPAPVPEPALGVECKAVKCGMPQPTANAISTDSGKSFGETATWTCKPGYSIDGMQDGPVNFVQACLANGVFSRSTPADCVDVNFCFGSPCGAFGTCKDAGPGKLAPFYSCSCYEGYEPKPAADGNMTCSEDDCARNECGAGGGCVDLSKSGGPDGQYTCECLSGYALGRTASGMATCLRRSCGALPDLANLRMSLDGTPAVSVVPYPKATDGGAPASAFTDYPVLFAFDTASYTCTDGYSADGTAAPASKTVSVSCGAAGVWSRSLSKDRECQPVRCPAAMLPSLPYTAVVDKPESNNYLFGQQASYRCVAGYSRDGKAKGPTTFTLDCLASGTFSDPLGSCVPIECTVPTLANSVASKAALFAFQNLTFSCAGGFVVQGKEPADTCDLFSTVNPSEETRRYSAFWGGDYNHRRSELDSPQAWSAASPVNGDWVQVDLGATKTLRGVVTQGRTDADQWVSRYTVSTSVDGSTFTQVGGTFEANRDRNTKIQNLFPAAVKARFVRWTVQAFVNFPSMRAGVLVCATGITKTSVNNVPDDKRSFSSVWGGSDAGALAAHRRSSLDSPQAWSCSHPPRVGEWVQMDLGGKQNVCGVMTQGRADADQWVTKYTVRFSVDGLAWVSLPDIFAGNTDRNTKVLGFFSEPAEAQYVRVVVAGFVNHASMRTGVLLCEKDNVTSTFGGTCSTDGTVRYDTATPQCVPQRCGEPPAQLNAVHRAAGSKLVFRDSFPVDCLPGFSVGGIAGAATNYLVTCSLEGKYQASVSANCMETRFTVSGLVSDATDRAVPVPGANVSFSKGGILVGSTLTDAGGVYRLPLPAGDITFNASSSGYIRTGGNVTVNGSLSVGQGADISLSKPLGEGGWRIVLTWGRYPSDLDSHVYFGCDNANLVSRGRRHGISEGAGGLEVSLDRDAAAGYGAETTTIAGADKCKRDGCCLITFKVEHVADPADGTLGSSGAMVKVYKGSAEVGSYKVPTCIGAGKWWTALTIDASKAAVFAGEKLMPPFLAASLTAASAGIQSWSASFDSVGWSKVSSTAGSPAVIYGLDMQHPEELHRLDAAKYFVTQSSTGADCVDVVISGTLDKEQWSSCPAGYFISGLYRTGSKVDAVTGYNQLTQLQCCKPKLSPPAYGQCATQALVSGKGWTQCLPVSGISTALVALRGSWISMSAPVPDVCTPEKQPLHGSTGVGVFLGGQFIQLGIRTNSQVGKMGTDEPKLGGLKGRNWGMGGAGMTANARGFRPQTGSYNPALTIDYFLPGSPEESWWGGYVEGGVRQEIRNAASSVRDITDRCDAKATIRTVGTLGGKLEITQDISLGNDDKFFMNKVTLKNVGPTVLSQVRFMRSHDPDNTVDQGGNYVTLQTLEKTIPVDGTAAVSAKSLVGDPYFRNSGGNQAVVMYFSSDPRAKASYGFGGLSPGGIYDPQVYDSPPGRGSSYTQDAYISIAMQAATLAAGESTTFVYYTALDSAPVGEIVSKLATADKKIMQLAEAKCCAMQTSTLIDGAPACAVR